MAIVWNIDRKIYKTYSMVNVCTTCCNIHKLCSTVTFINSAFCVTVFGVFRMVLTMKRDCFPNNINWLAFLIYIACILRAVWTDSLYIISLNDSLQRVRVQNVTKLSQWYCSYRPIWWWWWYNAVVHISTYNAILRVGLLNTTFCKKKKMLIKL